MVQQITCRPAATPTSCRWHRPELLRQHHLLPGPGFMAIVSNRLGGPLFSSLPSGLSDALRVGRRHTGHTPSASTQTVAGSTTAPNGGCVPRT